MTMYSIIAPRPALARWYRIADANVSNARSFAADEGNSFARSACVGA